MASLAMQLDSSDKKVELLTREVHQHGVQLEDHQSTIEVLKKDLAQYILIYWKTGSGRRRSLKRDVTNEEVT